MTHQDRLGCHFTPSRQVGCFITYFPQPLTNGHLESNFSDAECRLCNNWKFLQKVCSEQRELGGVSRLKQVCSCWEMLCVKLGHQPGGLKGSVTHLSTLWFLFLCQTSPHSLTSDTTSRCTPEMHLSSECFQCSCLCAEHALCRHYLVVMGEWWPPNAMPMS